MSLFKGSGVAIVTPFKEDGEINYEEFKRLLNFQIENDTDAIIIAGTTGEASTMTEEEHIKLIKYGVEVIDGRVPAIAGTGGNDTRQSLRLCHAAEEAGADGLLVVTPYYNKPSQEGLKQHYIKIADNIDIPIILYTVPGRTGMNIEPETVRELSKHENIVGLKDATGNLSYTVEVKRLCGEDFDVYSGNDDVIIPLMSVGGSGVISVLANCMPKETHDMVYAYLDGDMDKARDMQLKYKPFIDALFCESNPIPVKAAMDMMGYDTGRLRLPMVEISEDNRKRLKATMEDINLI